MNFNLKTEYTPIRYIVKMFFLDSFKNIFIVKHVDFIINIIFNSMNDTEKEQILQKIAEELANFFSEVENIGNRFYVKDNEQIGSDYLWHLADELEKEFKISLEIVVTSPTPIFLGTQEHAHKLMQEHYGWCEPGEDKCMWYGTKEMNVTKELVENLLV